MPTPNGTEVQTRQGQSTLCPISHAYKLQRCWTDWVHSAHAQKLYPDYCFCRVELKIGGGGWAEPR